MSRKSQQWRYFSQSGIILSHFKTFLKKLMYFWTPSKNLNVYLLERFCKMSCETASHFEEVIWLIKLLKNLRSDSHWVKMSCWCTILLILNWNDCLPSMNWILKQNWQNGVLNSFTFLLLKSAKRLSLTFPTTTDAAFGDGGGEGVSHGLLLESFKIISLDSAAHYFFFQHCSKMYLMPQK